MAETWVLNADLDSADALSVNVRFSAYDTEFINISGVIGKRGGYLLEYRNTDNSFLSVYDTTYTVGISEWRDEAYRSIAFDTAPTGVLLTWLEANAVKQVSKAVNKVDINGETVIDLTADTVTPETLDAGVTAHNSAGEVITGTREAVSYPLPVSKGGTGATTAAAALANLGAPSLKVFTNVTIAISAFAASDRYAGYPYAATIALSGVTESMYPDVAFDVTDASGGNFAPVAVSQNGSVRIFAAEPKAITIPTILLMG